jgi:uncharacterized protein YjiS (DUF1127 family)
MKQLSSYTLKDAAPGSAYLADAIRRMRKIAPLIAEWRQRYRYRADLKRLLKVGPYMIDDIGLAYEEAKRESAKAFWKP